MHRAITHGANKRALLVRSREVQECVRTDGERIYGPKSNTLAQLIVRTFLSRGPRGISTVVYAAAAARYELLIELKAEMFNSNRAP
jgi:hypothetical protein